MIQKHLIASGLNSSLTLLIGVANYDVLKPCLKIWHFKTINLFEGYKDLTQDLWVSAQS